MSIFSDLKVYPVQTKQEGSNLVARGSVVVNQMVRFQFSVMNGSKGRFVAMPSEKSNKIDEVTKKPKYFPIVSLTKEENRDELNRLVLAELDNPSPKEVSSSPPARSRGTPLPF